MFHGLLYNIRRYPAPPQIPRNGARSYVGLALYRTDIANANNDPGWDLKHTNLSEQIAELTEKGADGYVLFSAQYLYRKCAAEELKFLMDAQN